jgi:hypothetical protein
MHVIRTHEFCAAAAAVQVLCGGAVQAIDSLVLWSCVCLRCMDRGDASPAALWHSWGPSVTMQTYVQTADALYAICKIASDRAISGCTCMCHLLEGLWVSGQ